MHLERGRNECLAYHCQLQPTTKCKSINCSHYWLWPLCFTQNSKTLDCKWNQPLWVWTSDEGTWKRRNGPRRKVPSPKCSQQKHARWRIVQYQHFISKRVWATIHITILSPKNVELGNTFNNVIEKAWTPYVMWISSALPLCQVTTSIAHQQGAHKLPSNL